MKEFGSLNFGQSEWRWLIPVVQATDFNAGDFDRALVDFQRLVVDLFACLLYGSHHVKTGSVAFDQEVADSGLRILTTVELRGCASLVRPK